MSESTKTKVNTAEQAETEKEKLEESFESISSPQARVAARMAASVAPVIAKEIMSGKITFAALTVIVDDKYSGTFPFYPMVATDAPNEEKYASRLTHAKINMLTAVEFAKTAALFKHKSFKSFEDGFFDPPTQ